MSSYFILVFVVVGCFADFDDSQFWRVNARWPREGEPVFLSHWATWDAAHYLYLSEVGYRKNVSSCAFYPLLPLLVRSFSVMTGGNHVVGGMILANLFSTAALAIFFGLVKRRFGREQAWLALAFLSTFPGSLFLHFVYSEGLFFLLVMFFVLGLEQGRHGLVVASGFLLPMTRALGVFCALPLLWHLIDGRFWPRPPNGVKRESKDRAVLHSLPLAQRMKWSPSKARNSSSIIEQGLANTRGQTVLPPVQGDREPQCGEEEPAPFRGSVAWAAGARHLPILGLAPILGYATYFGLMWHWTGNPWEGFEAQRFWGHIHSITNLWDMKKCIVGFFNPTTWHEFHGSVLDRCVFALLVYCLPVIWKLDKGWFIWAVVLGVVPAMSGTFTSFTRFASVVFPMFIALAVVFSDRRWRWARYGLLAVFGILHAILVWRFVNFRWAG